jgi:hypothetical protein
VWQPHTVKKAVWINETCLWRCDIASVTVLFRTNP